MKIVYTSENSLIVNNISNVLEQEGIEVQLKNEFVRGVLGEVAAQEAWLELWVVNNDDFDRASKIVERVTNKVSGLEWVCQSCNEKNAASFYICWNCQNEKP